MRDHVALLRAVNLGGGSVVRSAELESALRALGLEEVRVLLASGNVAFRAPEGRGEPELEARIAEGLKRRLGLVTEVFVRSAGEWREVRNGNPFTEAAREDPAHLVVAALKSAPGADRWEALARAIRGRESSQGRGRHAYLVYPDGIGRSKLTVAVLEASLGTRATCRNWNTVQKLGALLE